MTGAGARLGHRGHRRRCRSGNRRGTNQWRPAGTTGPSVTMSDPTISRVMAPGPVGHVAGHEQDGPPAPPVQASARATAADDVAQSSPIAAVRPEDEAGRAIGSGRRWCGCGVSAIEDEVTDPVHVGVGPGRQVVEVVDGQADQALDVLLDARRALRGPRRRTGGRTGGPGLGSGRGHAGSSRTAVTVGPEVVGVVDVEGEALAAGSGSPRPRRSGCRAGPAPGRSSRCTRGRGRWPPSAGRRTAGRWARRRGRSGAARRSPGR